MIFSRDSEKSRVNDPKAVAMISTSVVSVDWVQAARMAALSPPLRNR